MDASVHHDRVFRAAGSAGARPGLVIAVDGPSGTGKSTVARAVAHRLGLRYLDTGATYRAVTWAVLEAGSDPAAPAAVERVAARTIIEVDDRPDDPRVRVCGAATGAVDVTIAIRSATVTAAVSAVSAHPAVRERLVALQREVIGAGGIVVEGRDIGTVVAPAAPVKVFLTASEDVRALRRAGQDAQMGAGNHMPSSRSNEVSAVREALARRDRFDSTRLASPLRRAADAVEVDTTDMSEEQVIDRIVAIAEAATRDGTTL